MSLNRLLLSVSLRAGGADHAVVEGRPGANGNCRFCGARRGYVSGHPAGAAGSAACVLCALVVNLDRPRIDEEAVLIWLPEMTQPALNLLLRRILLRLRALGEPLGIETTPALSGDDRPWLYHARRVLLDRREAAAARLTTTKPADLAGALLRLKDSAYARRAQLLGGIRLLATGCFFEGANDIFPCIVDSWASAKALRAAA